ncbi:PadR family transcriptional regulator [Cohnella cellulosilytica]|uniref:Helix-turn-helix transcriptional regulator n=1 Tax=Cohnella cellulosilytica TaxID=986710 RepID=A0ABW2FIS4_9BACL
MPKPKRSNLLALAALSLLNEKPMHPYEIGVVMKQRGMADTIKLNTGSLYAVIEHLLKNGLIEPLETVKEGKHPERTIYCPTALGREEFFDWLRVLLRTPSKEYSQFAAGLSFIGHLSPNEAYHLLREREIPLKGRIEQLHSSMDATVQAGISHLFVVETDYELALLEAELKWLERLIQNIESGPYTERTGEQWRWAVRFES